MAATRGEIVAPPIETVASNVWSKRWFQLCASPFRNATWLGRVECWNQKAAQMLRLVRARRTGREIGLILRLAQISWIN